MSKVWEAESGNAHPLSARVIRLVNTINYDESNFSSIYSIARHLPCETMKLWLNTIQDNVVQPIDTVLDLGCGEGRFSSALSNAFHAKVYGIDARA